MSIVLYTTDCPRCKVLEKKMDEKGMEYEIISDEQLMIDKGFMSAPMLEVEGEVMSFRDAVDWVNEQ